MKIDTFSFQAVKDVLDKNAMRFLFKRIAYTVNVIYRIDQDLKRSDKQK